MSASDKDPNEDIQVADQSDAPAWAATSHSASAPQEKLGEQKELIPTGVDTATANSESNKPSIETCSYPGVSCNEASEQTQGCSTTTGGTTGSTTPAEKQSPTNQGKVGELAKPAAANSQQSANSQRDAMTPSQEDEKGVIQTGKCKWFDSRRGFGFITPDDGSEDVFVHQQCIVAEGFRSLREGEKVEYKVQTDEKGRKKAVCISGPGGAPVQGEVGGGYYRGRGAYQDAWYGGRGYSRRGIMMGGGGRGMGGLSRGQHPLSNRGGGMYQGFDPHGMQDFRRAPYFPFRYAFQNYLPTDYAIMTDPYAYMSQPGPADYPYQRYYPGT